MSDLSEVITLRARIEELERQLCIARARILELNHELDAEIAKSIKPAHNGLR